MKFVFLMDPLETVVYEKDTSFILMLGSYRREHGVYFCPNGGIYRKNGKTFFKVVHVVPQENKDNPFIIKEKHTLSEDDVDAVFIRTDPPFDYQYLLNSWYLDLIPKSVPIINDPAGIRSVNEKIWATQFKDVLPSTFVGRDADAIKEFVKENREVVAKPTDGFGGKGVFIIREGDPNINVILETLTKNFTEDIIVQQYVPESVYGDKRILLLNGEPLGAVLRVHSPDDHRNNFFSGGKATDTEITPRDLEIVNTIKAEIKKLGLYFVGIDIIGDYLVEINVTSPTCLQEMNHFMKTSLEDKVIEFTEKLVDQSQTHNKISI